jgi:hypothetical protein
MSDKIKEYIKTEKQLSISKISYLSKVSKPYAKRLIEKEKRFIDFDFSKIKFSSIDECRDAVSLFKISKSEFKNKYMNNSFDFSGISQEIKKYSDELSIINGMIDGYFFRSLKGKSLFKESGELKKVVEKRIVFLKFMLQASSMCVVESKNFDIDNIISCIFKYTQEPDKFKNLFSADDFSVLKKSLSNYLNIIDLANELIHKTDKTDLIIFDIKHSGNEKVNSLYSNIVKKGDENVKLTKSKFSNYPINDDYHKCLKIASGQLDSLEKINFEKSMVICNFSRREMDYMSENLIWLKFTLDKIIN